MKLDQIAYYAHSSDQAEEIKRLFNLVQDTVWVQDIVHGHCELHQNGRKLSSSGRLQFNYNLGIELEILTYFDNNHWHYGHSYFHTGQPFLSHHGFHLEDDEPFPELAAPLVQEMFTRQHTNAYVTSRNRTYHYRIHDTRPWTGVFSKFIKRIHHDAH